MMPIDQVRSFLADLIGGPDTPFMVRREQSAQFEAAFVMPAGVHAEAGSLGGIKVEWIVPFDVHVGDVAARRDDADQSDRHVDQENPMP